MTTTTYPTANGVSRTLGKRHTRSTSTGTMVRGYRRTTEGFRVRTVADGSKVCVEHVGKSGVHRPEHDYAGVAERRIEAYAATLTAAGYTLTVNRNGVASRIIVTGRA